MVSNFDNEKDIFKIYSLDYTEELINKYLYKDKNLLINNCDEECLINIFESLLSNLIFHKKQVLILSNNYIDEIKNTNLISNLGAKVINWAESDNIESCLKEQILSLPDSASKIFISKVQLLSRSINKKINKLQEIINFFCVKKENSLSIVEKYNITSKKLSKDDFIFKYYKIYRIKKPLENYSYSEVINAIDRILDLDITKKYIKYRRFIDNNMLKILINPIDYDKLNLAIYKIDELVKNIKVQAPLITSQYTEDFIETFLINRSMENNDLKGLVNIVNLKYNYNLLTHKKQKGLLNIFNKKKEKTIYESNLNKFLSIEKEITKEYMENLKILKLYIKNIEFLKNILNEETYDELLLKLIKGEDIKDHLILYRKMIHISYSIKDTAEYINNIKKIDREILDYCYNNVENKKEINDIILSIPKLKLYLEIEEEEIKNHDILDKYNEFDKLINEIEEDLINKKNLISTSINYIWDNILHEKLYVSRNTIEKIDFSNKEIYKNLFPCIITNLDNYNLLKSNREIFNFDKIIILDNLIKPYIDKLNNFDELNNNAIMLSKDKVIDVDLRNYNNFDIVEIKKSLTNTLYNANPIINEIHKYLENLGYIVECNITIDIFNIPLVVRDINLNIIAVIQIDGEPIEKDTNYLLKDIYLNIYLNNKDIKLYRIWSRDWWINKSKELSNLVEFLNETTKIH